jgi:hypothetical protein
MKCEDYYEIQLIRILLNTPFCTSSGYVLQINRRHSGAGWRGELLEIDERYWCDAE